MPFSAYLDDTITHCNMTPQYVLTLITFPEKYDCVTPGWLSWYAESALGGSVLMLVLIILFKH